MKCQVLGLDVIDANPGWTHLGYVVLVSKSYLNDINCHGMHQSIQDVYKIGIDISTATTSTHSRNTTFILNPDN